MANIYEQRSEDLNELLNRASSGDGATVVIPDLQRPFVWNPQQVVLLLDSLIRGWPFGTLLMWKVADEKLGTIPHREFWQLVDRRADPESAKMHRKDPPAEYHMVLDGQQRVQSLLLALCGDGWGFCLEDRAWTEHLTGVRARGRKHKHPHWSKGTLCFDIGAFLKQYEQHEDVIGIDYREVLVWAVTDPAKGQSPWAKPDNYNDPLPRAFDEDDDASLIRLSRLWSLVAANANVKEKQFREQLEPFLANHHVKEEVISALLNPMGELLSTLRDVKLSKVTYLELRPFDETLWSEDEYNEAIVNIFTRLNTAGRTLTREEITFAWLKIGWDSDATNNQTAGQCFSALLHSIREDGLSIEMDDLVRAASVIWSVGFRDGELLQDKDLLRGDTLRPMAGDLAKSWDDLTDSIGAVMSVVHERELRYGQNAQYYSLNALTVLWAWYFLSRRWLRVRQPPALKRDSYDKELRDSLSEFVDRWLICSHWAGRWSGSSSRVLAGYAGRLHKHQLELMETMEAGDSDLASRFLTELLDELVAELLDDAAEYARNYSLERRGQVSRYGTLLWVWHRLDTERWSMSRIALRTTTHKKCSLDVDHTVAYSRWEKLVQEQELDAEAASELINVANTLGNCIHLEKSFNISKSAKPLREFLQNVHEFAKGQVDIQDWASALGLPQSMLEPVAGSALEIAAAIRARDSEMREELVEFIKGHRTRQDLVPGPADG